MDLFKARKLEWWEVGMLKISLFSIGLAAGAYWQDFFLPYAAALAVFGFVLAFYLLYAWFRQN
jgi:hypothetical protein